MSHLFAFFIVSFNFLIFGLSALYKFRNGHATKGYSVFAVAWWVSCVGILLLLVRSQQIEGPLYFVGLAIAFLSLGVFCAALRAMWSNPFTVIFSSDVPTRIESTGIYKVVRHPFYLAYMLNYLSAALVSRDPIVVSLTFAMCCVYVRAALSEEKRFASSHLRDVYEEYKARTGRFLPFVG